MTQLPLAAMSKEEKLLTKRGKVLTFQTSALPRAGLEENGTFLTLILKDTGKASSGEPHMGDENGASPWKAEGRLCS